jgi:hypothetical protein
MFRCLVLDDLERPDTGALNTATGQKEPAVACGAQQSGAGTRKVSLWIEVICDADSMLQDRSLSVVACIDVDPAPQSL